MSVHKRIFRNSLALLVAQTLTKLSAWILVVCAARTLGSFGYGKYAFALSFVGMFVEFSDLGISTILVREIAKDTSRVGYLFGNALTLKAGFIAVIFALCNIAIRLLGYPQETIVVVGFVSIALCVNAFYSTFNSVFRGLEHMEFEALAVLIGSVASTTFGIFALTHGYKVVGLAFALALAQLVMLPLVMMIGWRRFVKPTFALDVKLSRYLLRESIVFGAALIFVALYFRMDTILLSFLRGDEAVGWYNAAYKFIDLFKLIPSAIMGAVLPVATRSSRFSLEKLEIIYGNAFRILAILAFPIALGVTFLADKIVPILYGSGYIPSISALQVLIWALVFIFSNSILINALLATANQRYVTLSTGICAIFNISLNIVLIPQFSYMGSAITTVLTEGLLFGLVYYWVSSRVIKLRLSRYILRPLLSGGALAIGLGLSRHLGLTTALLVGALIYSAALLATRSLRSEWHTLREMFFG